MRVRFGPVHLSRELPRGHSRAMLPSERNALINEIDAAKPSVVPGRRRAELVLGAARLAPGGALRYAVPASRKPWVAILGLSNKAPHLVRNTFGAFVGGPIIKDRLFFFCGLRGWPFAAKPASHSYRSQRHPADWQHELSLYQDPTCPSSGVNTLTAADLALMDNNCSSLGTCPNGPDRILL